MDVQVPTMGIKVDGAGVAYLTYDCPECGHENVEPVKGLGAGSSVTCLCGETTIDLTGDSLAALQNMLDRGESGKISITVKPHE